MWQRGLASTEHARLAWSSVRLQKGKAELLGRLSRMLASSPIWLTGRGRRLSLHLFFGEEGLWL